MTLTASMQGTLHCAKSLPYLWKSVRSEDFVCRLGGEEFVVVLPMADSRTTQAGAERIRSKLSELSVRHRGQSLGAVTVSVGVAELPQRGTSAKELLEAADAALWGAKREERRERAETGFWSPLPPGPLK